MDKWKEILKKLLFLKTIWIFLLFNFSFVLLLYAFIGKNCPPAVQYFSYTLSAYTLAVVCVRIPNIVKAFKSYLHKNRYTNKYLTEKELQIRISLYSGLLINISFAIFKVIMGILYQSKWLFAMAGYNTVLSIMRFTLVYRDLNEKKTSDDYERRLLGLHSYRICGWLMLLLNTAISTIVFFVVFDNQHISYPGFMIYAIAAYAFYYLTKSIISMVKYYHRQNPVFSAVKRIELAKALVSIFTLQVAMLTQFSTNKSLNYRIMNGVTGGIICVIITVMAILMLVGVKKDYLCLCAADTNRTNHNTKNLSTAQK